MKEQEKENSLLKLANAIRTRRQELQLSQEKLAERCGFDRTYISLLERAKRNPSFLNLEKISHGLNTKLSILLKEQEDG